MDSFDELIYKDHEVIRSQNGPGEAPTCPVCAGPAYYEDHNLVANLTMVFNYWCPDCDAQIIHEYHLKAVRTVSLEV